MLELDDVRQNVGEFDAAGLLYPWKHADSRLDALSVQVQSIASSGDTMKQSRAEIFERIWKAAAAEAQDCASWRLPEIARSAPTPRISEPWYCCAEPTQDQFIAIGAPAKRPAAPAHEPAGAGDFL